MGTQLLPQKGAQTPPNFRPIRYGQTTGWIKMPLDLVLDGDPAPFVSDIAIFVLKRDVKLQLTN